MAVTCRPVHQCRVLLALLCCSGWYVQGWCGGRAACQSASPNLHGSAFQTVCVGCGTVEGLVCQLCSLGLLWSSTRNMYHVPIVCIDCVLLCITSELVVVAGDALLDGKPHERVLGPYRPPWCCSFAIQL